MGGQLGRVDFHDVIPCLALSPFLTKPMDPNQGIRGLEKHRLICYIGHGHLDGSLRAMHLAKMFDYCNVFDRKLWQIGFTIIFLTQTERGVALDIHMSVGRD